MADKGTEQVDAYLLALEHPLKDQIEAVRKIIREASPKLAERVKWNSPSFYYQKDIVAIHCRENKFVHLVFVFPVGLPADSRGILEGDYKDRRMAYFHSMEEILEKKEALTQVIHDWIALMEQASA